MIFYKYSMKEEKCKEINEAVVCNTDRSCKENDL